jgi:hypothetical protein
MNCRAGIRAANRTPQGVARAVAGLVLSAALVACMTANSQANDPGGGADPTGRLRAVTEAALVDASQRTGHPRTKLKLIAAAAVTWRNGALGCPQPGMLYTDALVPGYRVVIEAAGQRLDYHASARGEPLLCPADRAEEPAPDGADGVR